MEASNIYYIVLEKARPYTRIRHGKLERVKGYQSRARTRLDQALDQNRPDVKMTLQIAKEVRTLGGRALIVGGFVRDALMGRRSKDLDVEVYGLRRDKLGKLLSSLGKVDEVGASFGVFKVKNESMDVPLDVSLPRRDNLVGVGHKGFVVETDEWMSPQEAASRRDLTINSMAYDPLKRKLIDPFGGKDDIRLKKLKATDEKHFAEDPLRVLRVMQFAGRFGFAPDAKLMSLCRSISLSSLPKERLYTELEKLLLKSKKPSKGLIYMPFLGITKIFPEIEKMMAIPQNPASHPEGDVWEHTLLVVDAARQYIDKFDKKSQMAVMLAALLHDVGKPQTTFFDETKGHTVSPGHQVIGTVIAEEFLKKITDDKELVETVKTLIWHHMVPHDLYKQNAPDSAIRRLARKVNISLLLALTTADKEGRGKRTDLRTQSWLLGKYKELKLDQADALKPLVMGRHLISVGVPPGKDMGRILDGLYEAQLEGKFKTAEEGLAYMKEHKLEEQPKPFGFGALYERKGWTGWVT